MVSSMNSVLLPSSVILQLPSRQSSPRHQLQPQYITTRSVSHRVHFISSLSCSFPSNSHCCLHADQSSIGAMVPSDEGPVSVINFEDFIEKDWSFLDYDELNPKEEHKQKIAQIITAGRIEETSRVLVSIGSEEFVDQLVDTSPCSLLLVVHDSLFILACIKEKYDKIKCWQGELIHVPEKWAPLDVVFLYFLPALPFKLDQVFRMLAKCCSQGARVVISHPQGREALEQQRKQHQDVIVSELPDKMTLQKVASDNSFEMAEFVDESGLYLAVLQFSGAKN
ncbi:hypothetical protein P3X46_009359 [Hevea brasiliensis]|uniref:Uncharacterized protein n=1 Tax=Hevea brasiliensis TaxID=3981 RepID=A0ABQ9MQ31_HEVBR|nr:uncharacterized protein LOC110656642 [Hevea brasiliensis]XP_021669207.2 uncharacterized protein LOC110656642 [Hevea brasiliensis]KAJ9181206.1 hypothetical protein P3X46_009359 [Hevea brasiliensis]